MKLYAYTLPMVAEKSGRLKIGQTAGSVEERIKAQLSQANLEYNIVWQGTGLIGKREISDHEIHNYLESKGFERDGNSEWFKCFPEDVQAALDTLKEQYHKADKREQLSDEFYERLRNWYYWVTESIISEGGFSPRQSSEYSLRIIIRLLLCFFLREKDLVPAELFDKNFIDENLKENEFRYYKAILRNLFFYSLNTPLHQRGELENRKLIEHYNKVKDVLHKRIPFLNGGLFTEHPGDNFALNDDYFFSEKRGKILKALADEKTRFQVEGIVRILLSYKYTLDETDDSEFIDPEFIGKIFECLLACIDAETNESRQQITGSYYTPRDIVDSMVNESLNAYLETQPAADRENALLRCSILDPACGSGAFPCGVMNVIMQRIDPDKTLTQSERYQKKLEILRNVIYGIDIQPMAVQIAMFRLFLSLVQEIQPTKDSKTNFGIESLPNLDYKFVCANTLVGIDVDGLFFNAHRPLFNQIIKLKEDYFKENIVSVKERLKERIEKAEQELAGQSDDDQIKMLCKWNHSETEPSPYFDSRWMFGVEKFDVVIGNPPYGIMNKKQNKTAGIIVTEEDLSYYKNSNFYKPAMGGMLNIFRLFILKSIELMNETGVFSQIFPLAFIGDASIKKLRQFVFDNTTIRSIEAFPERDNPNKRVFKSSKTSVCIVNLTKQKRDDASFFVRINRENTIDKSADKNYLTRAAVEILDRTDLTIPLTTSEETKILMKCYQGNEIFSKYGHCYTGEIDMTFCKSAFSDDKRFAVLHKGAIIDRYLLRDTMSQGEVVYLNEKKLAAIKNVNPAIKNQERIVLQGITGVNEKTRIKAMIIRNAYCANSLNYLVFDNEKIQIQYMLGILNSKLINFIFSRFSTNSNVNGYEIDNLPIKLATPIIEKKMIALVSRRLQGDIKTEKRIDGLVYELYGLTAEEIQIVAGEK